MRVAAGHDGFAGLQERAERVSELHRELGSDLDVGEPADADAAEQRAGPFDAVDQRHRDERAGTDVLVRPQFDVGANDRAAADDAVASDDRPLADENSILDDVAIGDGRAGHCRRFTEIGIAPRDRTIERGVSRDDRGITHSRFRPDDRTCLDNNVFPEDDRRDEMCVGVNVAILTLPNPSRDLGARHGNANPSVQGVVVCLLVLLQVADVGPVVLRDVALHQLVFVQHSREEVAREIVILPALHIIEDARVEDVNAGVDRVRENFSPRWFLEETSDAPALVGDHDPEFERVRDAL